MQQYRFFFQLQMFIINPVSTCFGHHYIHHQENNDRVLLHMVFVLVVLDVAGSGFVMLRYGCEHCEGWCLSNLHSAHTLQRSTTVPQPATSNTTS